MDGMMTRLVSILEYKLAAQHSTAQHSTGYSASGHVCRTASFGLDGGPVASHPVQSGEGPVPLVPV
jgi:hypothetical protein